MKVRQASVMGMNRATYERRFKELFAEIAKLVDNEVERWRGRGIEVRKDEISPTRFVYIVEWQGRPLNAFTLEFRPDSSGYSYIALHYDNREEEIYRILKRKKAALLALLCYFIKETIIAEAKRVALQHGLFAKIKSGDLIVQIGGYEFRFEYLQGDNSWRVECHDFRIWEEYKCGDLNPLEFLSDLLRAFVIRLSL